MKGNQKTTPHTIRAEVLESSSLRANQDSIFLKTLNKHLMGTLTNKKKLFPRRFSTTTQENTSQKNNLWVGVGNKW
jgi:hypothetical protein